ncbi:hypothetical protein J4V81_26715, partial [Escherichia coli]
AEFLARAFSRDARLLASIPNAPIEARFCSPFSPAHSTAVRVPRFIWFLVFSTAIPAAPIPKRAIP